MPEFIGYDFAIMSNLEQSEAEFFGRINCLLTLIDSSVR
jgi:hypothetical protein